MSLAALDRLPAAEARAALARCCGSRRWVEAMVAARPHRTPAALHAAAEAAFDALGRDDWLEAFAAHPRIGDAAALHARFASTAAWAGAEQAGAAGAAADTLAALAAGNREYERRFGYTFIVCATGRSAAQMLDLLHRRLDHPPADELRVAAAEQRAITRLRLAKLLEETP